MSLPKNYTPRKGDVLLVRATVKYDSYTEGDREAVSVSVGRYDSHASVGPEQIERILIPFFNVGEVVTIEGIADLWKIRAIQGDAAWVQSIDGVFKTVLARTLTIAPKTLAAEDQAVEA